MITISTESDSICHEHKKSLEQIIDKIGHYLPSQGPISTFVHHNTLHQFEGYNFFEGIEKAALIYSARAYFPEQKYHTDYSRGRITQADINKILGDENIDGRPWISGLSKRKFYRSLLLSTPPPLTLETLRWRLVEKKLLASFLPQISSAKRTRLLNEDKASISHPLLEKTENYLLPPNREWEHIWPQNLAFSFNLQDIDKIRSKWKESDSINLLWIFSAHFANQIEKEQPLEKLQILYNSSLLTEGLPEELSQVEELINPYLIKFTSCFLDVGLAHLSVANRQEGLLKAFISHMKYGSPLRPPWLEGNFHDYENKSNIEIISNRMLSKKINSNQWNDYLLRKALILKGWGGLIYKTEIKASGLMANASLADFLAIRLILEENAEKYLENKAKNNVDSESILGRRTILNNQQKDICAAKSLAYHAFSAFQLFGLSASQLISLQEDELIQLRTAFMEFSSTRRLRIWHRAYEWNLYSRAISAIVSINSNKTKLPPAPMCQIVCCIDDREESFRRYIEEMSAEYQTFGTAGFFGVDAEFHNLYERPAPYCPVNVVPTHQIKVVARSGSEQKIAGIGRLKQIQSDFDVILESQSRSLFRGWLLALGGILALFPLSISTIAPRLSHKLKIYLKKTLVNPLEESALIYAQSDSEDNNASEDSHGFTVEEMAFRVKTLLTTTGLIKTLAPLVVIIGHGSFSMNNPYRSAYDCGACGGRPGRLNPRAFAGMANRKDVREFLSNQNFIIPEAVYFIGAFHNTCTDELEYFDKSILPTSHQKLFDRVKKDLDTARAKNALERCRRFDEIKVTTVKQAIAHVESRAHHIAQPRPEYGHATNAFCYIGRRDFTRNLFLDRRAFLVSYDKTIDEEQLALRNLLKAVIPVCMGINLEYFFSSIDNKKYGAGTKLPHNVTSLLGLMTGYCSDLRTGLPTQMIEIHEATRLFLIIDLEPELILKTLEQEPELFRLCKNRWVILSAYDSASNQMFFLNEANEFEKVTELALAPLKVESSLSWVVGKKDHLDFVEISA